MLIESGSQELFPLSETTVSMQRPSCLEVPTVQPLQDTAKLGLDNRHQTNVDIMTYTQYVNGSIFSIPKRWNQETNDDMLVSVYSFMKTFVSASGAGQGSIDNRIEQAMDLVKSHLMSAVRSEVEELRDKISKLEDTVTILSRENEVLRSNVAPEVLASLTGGNRSLGLSCPPPDPSSSHPALQQSSNH